MARSEEPESAGRMEWVEDPALSGLALLLAVEEGRTELTCGMTPTWTEEITRYRRANRCPVCSGPPRGRVVCLVCSASARNPYRHSMQAPPEAPAKAPPPLSRKVRRSARKAVAGVA
jgi:hypothetical protein